MQFRPPSQPGWDQPEPDPLDSRVRQPQQPLPMQQTGYYPWPQQQADVPPQQQWRQQPPQFLTPQMQWEQPAQPYFSPQQPMYPPQPQQWPPMQPMPPQKPRSAFKLGLGVGCGFMAAIALVIVVIAVLASAGSHSSYTPTSTTASQITPATSQSSPDSSQPTSAPQPTTFKVGETATDSTTWSVTMNSVKTVTSGTYASPAAGNIYLVIDVTTENLSSTPHLVSSEGSFTLKDTTGQVYNEAITGIGVAPDGTIQPGTKLRGQIVYEVPKSMHDFTFQFQGNVYSGSAAIWAFSV